MNSHDLLQNIIRSLSVAISLVLMPCLSFANSFYSVYGQDDRHEVFEQPNSSVRTLAESVVAILSERNIKRAGDESFNIVGATLKKTYDLCPSEKFAQQVVAPGCTGFLVSPQHIATAGHCVTSHSECQKLAFVFDYGFKQRDSSPYRLQSTNVYRCTEIVSQKLRGEIDFAVVKLDRVVEGRQPLRLRTEGELAIGEELFTIGHPSGLPAKIATGARVRKLKASNFISGLDVFAGNSGSPIFNAQTLEVEGIVIAGAQDYKKHATNSCNIVSRCPENACMGETALKISEIHYAF